MADWQQATRELLAERPGLTVRQIRAHLTEQGIQPPAKSAINSHLYRSRRTFRHEGAVGALPRWYLQGILVRPTTTATMAAQALPAVEPEKLGLYPWQVRALDSWVAVGARGVVEAVTGAGKTRVAMAAIAMQLEAGGRVAILVHTRELVEQWVREVNKLLPAVVGRQVTIGRLGGGAHQTLKDVEVLVATAQSAAGWELGLNSASGLLIADEVHHYGAQAWSRGLEEGFDRRLGLTATYDREDSGLATYLDPYFGGVCYSVDYAEAWAMESSLTSRLPSSAHSFGRRKPTSTPHSRRS